MKRGVDVDLPLTERVVLALITEGTTHGWAVADSCPGPIASQLAQALSNIVGNALRHGSAATPIAVSTSTAGGEAIVTVHNDGTPIPAALMPQLFDPFRRGTTDRNRSAPGAGLGLGLFIAEQIIRAHDGRIEVSSSATDGTTVSIRLPLQRSVDLPPLVLPSTAPA